VTEKQASFVALFMLVSFVLLYSYFNYFHLSRNPTPTNYFTASEEWMAGRTFYSEIDVHITPLSMMVNAGLFELFGHKVSVAVYALIVFQSVVTVIVYFLMRKLGCKIWMASIIGLFYVLCGIEYSALGQGFVNTYST